VPDDGVFQHSGFRSGDVIRSVNGQPVTSPAIVLQLPSALLQDSLVTVQIERDGRPLTLTYHLQ
jgi:general secretion pathway protein C